MPTAPHPRDLPAIVADHAERIAALEADTGIDPEADDALTAAELERAHSRDELDELAADAGVDAPDELPNKGAVAAAIVEARK